MANKITDGLSGRVRLERIIEATARLTHLLLNDALSLGRRILGYIEFDVRFDLTLVWILR